MSPKVIYLKNPWLKRLLIWRRFGARNWYWFILIDETLSQELQEALLGHELYHTGQMRRFGVFSYAYRYFTDKQFRLSIEDEAYQFGPDYWRKSMTHTQYWEWLEELYG